MNTTSTGVFKRIVWTHYRKNGRHDLPWRNLPAGRQERNNPYKILVSEVMLQQTQVERVIPYYKAWMKKFPTAKALAKAPLGEVLKAWQGLGYNRRGKMLHMAGKQIGTSFPTQLKDIEALSGVGPYTARAVLAFAYNEDVVFVETNIRTAIIHHFFPKRNISIYGNISDAEILKIVEKVLPKGKAREWYGALMDYGSYLKRSGIRTNAKVKGYTKQSRFAGSAREARGAVLRELAKGNRAHTRLLGLLGDDRMTQTEVQIQKLLKEGMIQKRGSLFRLPR